VERYLGLLGAVTPKYDDVAELHSVLGERFVLYRPIRMNPEAEARAAIVRAEGGTEWRDVVAAVAARMVESSTKHLAHVRIPAWAMSRLIDLARLTAAGRATVAREGNSKVIRVLPEPEGRTRLAQQLGKLLRGLCAVRAIREPGADELAIIAKVARDTMPKARLVVLTALADGGGTKLEIADRTGLSPSTCEYHLQDLVTLGIATPPRGQARTRALSDEYHVLIERAGLFADVTARESVS
jgi:DNA-binding transcriptional ArsR family regulator